MATLDAGARLRDACSSQETHTSSPLLRSLLERMDENTRYEVLDLGPATPSSIDFFARYHCRLHIADCLTELIALDVADQMPFEQVSLKLRELLPAYEELRFDIVLAWDVLNYLDKAVLRALNEDLIPSTDRDTQLHAYVYPRQTMPATPSRFRISADGGLRIELPCGEAIASPCYTQPKLEELMPGFAVQHSVLLKNGIQEYLFRGRCYR